MTERWKKLSVVVGLVTLASVAMGVAAKEGQVSGRGRVPLRVVGTRFLGDHRQERFKNRLINGPATLTDAEEVFKRIKQKEYSKRKRKEKSKRRKKKVKVKKKLPAYIRRVASRVARPPNQLPRSKATIKAECGKSYAVGIKSKYRIRISQRESCSVIFRAAKRASLKSVCKTISVGDCEDAEYVISDGNQAPQRYCGIVPSTKVKLGTTDQLLMTYKPSQDASAGAPLPDVNCLVKGAKGTGYVAKGKQICPMSCGKTTAAAEAEKPYINASTTVEERATTVGERTTTVGERTTTVGERTTTRLSTASSLQELNITSNTTQLNTLPNASLSTSPAFSNSVTTASTSTAPTYGASTSTVRSYSNNTVVNTIRTNVSTPSLSLERRGRDNVRILGGKPADIGEWPFIVRILINFRVVTLPCAGMILTSTFILTAGHCVYDVNVNRDRVKVIAFEYNVKSKNETPSQSSPVKKIILHPEYDSKTQKADIALLLLKKPLVFGVGVSPVCIAPEGDYVGSKVVILGWGSLHYNGKDSDVLQEATQIVVDVNECEKNYSSLPVNDNNFPVTSDHLCAAAPGIDSCEGDSGGPVLIQIGTSWYQLGIVSFGFKCAIPGYPGVNTLVPSYAEWIFATVNEDKCD